MSGCRWISLRFFWVPAVVVAVLSGLSAQQSAVVADSKQAAIELTEIFPPIYPPLARQARIMGDVQIQVHIRKDGSVASAEAISGHPMLKQVALESAERSKFLCMDCTSDTNLYVVLFSFGFRNDGDCGYVRRRSLKCLKLWKCGSWQYGPGRPAVIGQSLNRVMVLADTTCVDTSS
jgi:TonB family protein